MICETLFTILVWRTKYFTEHAQSIICEMLDFICFLKTLFTILAWRTKYFHRACSKHYLQNVNVKFLHPKLPASKFFWPTSDDICWVPIENICEVNPPKANATGRYYVFENFDFQNN